MKKQTDHPYKGHLTVGEFCIQAGEEWVSHSNCWSVVQIVRGTGYYLRSQFNQALETGCILLITGGVKASIRASQLGELSLRVFNIAPARLTGLITLVEQSALETLSSRQESAVKLFPPDCLTAMKMEELCASQKKDGLPFRLKLLQIFVEMIGPELDQIEVKEETSDAKQRLQSFLKETPSSELLEINFNELAKRTHCTSRHLGRIFYQLVGMSFRDKRAAIRLERARELLATTDSKIVDVALESGFRSLSLFNLLFARHFGISPGKWRQKQEGTGRNPGNKKVRVVLTGNRPDVLPGMGKSNWNNQGAPGMTKGASRLVMVQ